MGAVVLLTSAGCVLDTERADFAMLGREPETIDPGLCSGQPGGRIILNAFENSESHSL